MKIGDKVRFLNEVGGGTIAGFEGKNIVLVEDQDGFEVPMLRSQVVVIETNESNRPIQRPTPIPSRNGGEQAGAQLSNDSEALPSTGERGEGLLSHVGWIPIISYRRGEVPGIHTVRYDSEADLITITHDAHSRKGFALGAVLAAEFTATHKGLLGMKDLFQF